MNEEGELLGVIDYRLKVHKTNSFSDVNHLLQPVAWVGGKREELSSEFLKLESCFSYLGRPKSSHSFMKGEKRPWANFSTFHMVEKLSRFLQYFYKSCLTSNLVVSFEKHSNELQKVWGHWHVSCLLHTYGLLCQFWGQTSFAVLSSKISPPSHRHLKIRATTSTTDVNCITAAFFPTVAYPKRAKQHVPHAAAIATE